MGLDKKIYMPKTIATSNSINKNLSGNNISNSNNTNVNNSIDGVNNDTETLDLSSLATNSSTSVSNSTTEAVNFDSQNNIENEKVNANYNDYSKQSVENINQTAEGLANTLEKLEEKRDKLDSEIGGLPTKDTMAEKDYECLPEDSKKAIDERTEKKHQLDDINNQIAELDQLFYLLCQERNVKKFECVQDLADYKDTISKDVTNQDYKDLIKENEKYITKDQQNILKYWYLKEGIEKANDYVDQLEDQINRYKGLEDACSFISTLNTNDSKDVMDKISDVFGTTGEGIGDGINTFLEGMDNYFTTNKVPSELEYKKMFILAMLNGDESQFTNEEMGYKVSDEFLEKRKALANIYEFSNAAGNMLPTIAMTAIVTAASEGLAGVATSGILEESASAMTKEVLTQGIKTGAQVAGNVTMGVSAAGNAKKQALEQGSTIGEAMIYGTLSGISEGAFEYFLGGLPGLSKTETGFIKEMINEGKEEGLQEIVSAMLGKSVLGDDINLDELTENTAKSFAMGAVMAAAMNGGRIVIGKGITTITNADVLAGMYSRGEYKEIIQMLKNNSSNLETSNSKITDKVKESLTQKANKVIDNVTNIKDTIKSNISIDNKVSTTSLLKGLATDEGGYFDYKAMKNIMNQKNINNINNQAISKIGNYRLGEPSIYEPDSFVALSDFHGSEWVLNKVKNHYMSEYETIFNLGDITDRGNDSVQMLLDYKKLSEENPNRVKYIPGNHDEFLYGAFRANTEQVRNGYIQNLERNGGSKTYSDMLNLARTNPNEFNSLLDWLGSQPLQTTHKYGGKDYAFAHAFFNWDLYKRNPNFSLADYVKTGGMYNRGQNSYYSSILWYRKNQKTPFQIDMNNLPPDNYTMVIGHTPNENNADLGNVKVICVDGGASAKSTNGIKSTRKFDGGSGPEVTINIEHHDTSPKSNAREINAYNNAINNMANNPKLALDYANQYGMLTGDINFIIKVKTTISNGAINFIRQGNIFNAVAYANLSGNQEIINNITNDIYTTTHNNIVSNPKLALDYANQYNMATGNTDLISQVKMDISNTAKDFIENGDVSGAVNYVNKLRMQGFKEDVLNDMYKALNKIIYSSNPKMVLDYAKEYEVTTGITGYTRQIKTAISDRVQSLLDQGNVYGALHYANNSQDSEIIENMDKTFHKLVNEKKITDPKQALDYADQYDRARKEIIIEREKEGIRIQVTPGQHSSLEKDIATHAFELLNNGHIKESLDYASRSEVRGIIESIQGEIYNRTLEIIHTDPKQAIDISENLEAKYKANYIRTEVYNIAQSLLYNNNFNGAIAYANASENQKIINSINEEINSFKKPNTTLFLSSEELSSLFDFKSSTNSLRDKIVKTIKEKLRFSKGKIIETEIIDSDGNPTIEYNYTTNNGNINFKSSSKEGIQLLQGYYNNLKEYCSHDSNRSKYLSLLEEKGFVLRDIDGKSYHLGGVVYLNKNSLQSGELSVFFHETGHYFDFLSSNYRTGLELVDEIMSKEGFVSLEKQSQLINLKHALELEIKKYMNNPSIQKEIDESAKKEFNEIIKKDSINYTAEELQETYNQIRKDKYMQKLNKYRYDNWIAYISDIIDAMTHGHYQDRTGTFGHGIEYYSDPSNVTTEILANFSALYAQGKTHLLDKFISKEFRENLEIAYKKVVGLN